MNGFADQPLAMLQLAAGWFLAQSLPLKVVVGIIVVAVLWVLWILFRVILVAVRAAFRGL